MDTLERRSRLIIPASYLLSSEFCIAIIECNQAQRLEMKFPTPADNLSTYFPGREKRIDLLRDITHCSQ